MKAIYITVFLFILTTISFAQSNDISNENAANAVSQEKYAEETHEGHNHDINSGGTKGCDPVLAKKAQEIIVNGTCPALEEYMVWDSGKTFYEYFPDFPKCPHLGNYISDKEGYYRSINEWCNKHKEDEELVRQILGFSTELKE